MTHRTHNWNDMQASTHQTSLTKRQLQIFNLTRKGWTQHETATELGISLSAVKQHLVALRQKFNVEKARKLGAIRVDWTANQDEKHVLVSWKAPEKNV